MTSRDPSIRTRTLIVVAVITAAGVIAVTIESILFVWANGWGK